MIADNEFFYNGFLSRAIRTSDSLLASRNLNPALGTLYYILYTLYTLENIEAVENMQYVAGKTVRTPRQLIQMEVELQIFLTEVNQNQLTVNLKY